MSSEKEQEVNPLVGFTPIHNTGECSYAGCSLLLGGGNTHDLGIGNSGQIDIICTDGHHAANGQKGEGGGDWTQELPRKICMASNEVKGFEASFWVRC